MTPPSQPPVETPVTVRHQRFELTDLVEQLRPAADRLVVWDRTYPAATTVGDVMVRTPKTCDSRTTVGQLHQLFGDDHVHVALLVEDGRLLTVIVRSDIPVDAPLDTPGGTLGRLAERVIFDTESLELARRQMLGSGQRRLAVINRAGSLLGLLCLKRSRAGFCTEQDIQDRAAERTARPAVPEFEAQHCRAK